MVHPTSLNHNSFLYTTTLEDLPQCASNSDCGPKQFCDYLVNLKLEISDRTSCFNIKICKTRAECENFDCLDATDEVDRFCGILQFFQFNDVAPANKPSVSCTEDMDCAHLIKEMVGEGGSSQNN
ncbi:unnamed protein product [Caenorhabditis bovis]|uniref:Uncharacterized protein n=1 Tax=Caenorhabditis bovis TaxID=2654633 RepID=A0A8S1EJD1_9PELO|nr:unnamed protein product [Caenorhabditis bovis]